MNLDKMSRREIWENVAARIIVYGSVLAALISFNSIIGAVALKRRKPPDKI